MISGKAIRRLLPLLGTLALLLLASAAGAAEAAGHGPSSEQWWNLLYRTLNFAVLVAVLIVVLRKPLKTGLGARVEQIKSELEELEAKREEARREYALMEQRLAHAAQEREEILKEFRALGEKEMAKIIASAQETAARIKEQASFTIEQETARAKADLRREVAEMSASVAEDLLKQKITSEDQTRLVDEYLDKVSREVQ
ncbi:MAG: F0F1 ATP synthase subunit B [Thermodesulfobacteriota bacterium]